LSTGVSHNLLHHEQTIERGLKTFVEVGTALAAIRDERLYRDGYETFEAYCKGRWGWERRHAYRLMDAAGVVANVSQGTHSRIKITLGGPPPLPDSERVARPLTKLPADEQADAWEEVVTEAETTGKPITAKKVQEVVDRRTGEVIEDAVVVETRTKSVGVSPNAHQPTRKHTAQVIAKTALELPHDPQAAAKTLVEFFDTAYLKSLVESINDLIER
jgi:hypothetical protein